MRSQYGKLAVMRAERGGAEPVGLVPVADREQRLDPVRDEQGAVDPVPAHRLEPRLRQPRRLSGPSQHRQHVGEVDVRSFQAEAIADLLGELQGLPKMREALLAAAEVGEVAAEHGERSDLRLACADRPSERERLLGRSAATPHSARPPSTRRASDPSAYARSGEGGSAGTSSTARSNAARQPSLLPLSCRYSPRRTWRSAARCGSSRADELDRSPCELDRARRRRPTWLASSAVQAQSSARSSPASSAASGTASHSASARSRCASASARPKTASAWRAASTDAASASALRPAAAQCGASSAGDAAPLRASSSASRACSSSRSPGRIVA